MKKIKFILWSWLAFQIEYLLMQPLTIEEKKKIITSAKDKLKISAKKGEGLSMCICLAQALMEHIKGSFKILRNYNLSTSVVRKKKFFRHFTAEKLGDANFMNKLAIRGQKFNQDRDYWFPADNLNLRISALNKLLKLEK